MEDNEIVKNTDLEDKNKSVITNETSELDNQKEQEKNNKQDKKKMKKSDKIFFVVTSTLIVILATYLILFSLVFFHVAVSGRSMDDTLHNGDILIANKVKTPDFGDVIIVSDMKDNGDWLIKRVVGVEGDTISIKDGKVYRNGELLIEEYAKGSTYAPDCQDPLSTQEVIYTVDEGEIFFLGDNREDSLDSRHYGNCEIESIEGVVSDFSIKIKGVTTPINKFFMRVKSFFGIKANVKIG